MELACVQASNGTVSLIGSWQGGALMARRQQQYSDQDRATALAALPEAQDDGAALTRFVDFRERTP